ncbi:FHA domain-containing protein [Sandaracinus amylolyticus]|uniref:FHA domain-containing protein n=1 Tax=Sandaracinus amylolyticus TaxID=927083 RepID=A0A0F6WAQ5_9BACT|nr:FHA domain-containing protein [Sandaracinus amylolyticus]AKF11665.1 hypothetical protein DB32_008814 [Sandaracinus amylolyticus]
MEAYVEVIREDGSLERHRIEGDQITVGKSPTAGVPIPDGRDLEPEHLLIAPRGEGCWVAIAQGSRVQAKVRGEAFQHGMVAWGTEIEIGGLKIKVTDSLPKEKKDGEQKTSPVVLIGGVGIVGILAWTMLSDPGGHGIETQAPTEQLQIFDAAVQCPQTGAQALYMADDDAEGALAKSERYPFDASDGVESVQLYRRSQACYALVGQAEAAARMQHEGDWMQHRIEEDYTTHRLRLERAMEQQRWPDALLETRALLSLTRHREHAYVQWLIRNERRLQLLVDQARS